MEIIDRIEEPAILIVCGMALGLIFAAFFI